MRIAISPRFAMSTFSNIGFDYGLIDEGENFAIFDRLPIVNDELR